MKCSHLFDNGKIAYVSCDDVQQVHSWASMKGVKVTVTTGLFLNPKTNETEKVSRIELLSELPKDGRRHRELSPLRQEIMDLYDAGMTQADIARKLGRHPQYISIVLRDILDK